jgi:hypothetical protein
LRSTWLSRADRRLSKNGLQRDGYQFDTGSDQLESSKMRKFVVAVSAFGFAAAASAQTPAPAPATSTAEKAQADYLNERICRTEELTGSRLAKKKVCKTRSQWADQQLQDRQEIERVQTQRSVKTP